MAFRYSSGTSDSAKPTKFPWEFAVPITPFWDTFPWKDAKCILKAFTAMEIQQLRLEDYASEPQTRKFEILGRFLDQKLALEEARYSAFDAILQNSDYTLWTNLLLAICIASTEVGDLEKAEQAHRSLIDGRLDPQDLVPINNFSAWLIDHTTRYDEAREFATQSKDWIDQKLGRSSPQAIGVRKTIAETYWKQGDMVKANETIQEIFDCVDGLKDTKFAVYKDSEREETVEWETNLKKKAE